MILGKRDRFVDVIQLAVLFEGTGVLLEQDRARENYSDAEIVFSGKRGHSLAALNYSQKFRKKRRNKKRMMLSHVQFFFTEFSTEY